MKKEISVREQDSRTEINACRPMPYMCITGRSVEPEIEYLRHKPKVSAFGNPNFRSVIKTFKNHAPTILNYFLRRSTNASAEAFNSKVKILPSQIRGVRDRNFFIFRLVKLFA